MSTLASPPVSLAAVSGANRASWPGQLKPWASSDSSVAGPLRTSIVCSEARAPGDHRSIRRRRRARPIEEDAMPKVEKLYLRWASG